MISLAFIRRTVLALSFSLSFMVMYLMLSCISGIITYSRAFTRRRVFSISSASMLQVFSTSASSKRSGRQVVSSVTAVSSSRVVKAKE